jgi:hypothetical protein
MRACPTSLLRRLQIASLIAGAAMAVAAVMPARTAEPITIGFSMAQSGPLAVNGKSALLAM